MSFSLINEYCLNEYIGVHSYIGEEIMEAVHAEVDERKRKSLQKAN